MAKKTAPVEKNPVGRPTDFRPEYVLQTIKLCRLGATDEEIAAFFEKSTTTIDNWKKKHPEFLGALKEGKLTSDIGRYLPKKPSEVMSRHSIQQPRHQQNK
jgi:hypothetical protein